MKTEPKDVFLHLLSMVGLYTSAISFITLVFQIINYYVPDALNDYYSSESILGTMRWAIAMLIVFFPTYIISMKLLAKSYHMDPAKRMLGVRKWLVYFTMLVAALIILGYFVALIYSFLEGDLTLQFFLKILSVFFVAGSIFSFYFVDMKKTEMTTV